MNVADDILMEQFLRNQLSEVEVIDFNERLLNDNEFKKHFEFEKQLFQTLNKGQWSFIENKDANEVLEYTNLFKNAETNRLKKTLKTINEVHKNEPKKLFQKKWIYIAAAVITLFFILNNYIFTNHTPQKLYITYFEQTNLPSLVNRGDNQIDLSKAQQLFDQKKFKEVIPVFESLISNGDSNSHLLIHLGISQMESNQYDKSEQTFNSLINNQTLITTKAYWFKALLYLKMNKIEQSKFILNKIKNEKLFNYKKATKLLTELNGM